MQLISKEDSLQVQGIGVGDVAVKPGTLGRILGIAPGSSRSNSLCELEQFTSLFVSSSVQ